MQHRIFWTWLVPTLGLIGLGFLIVAFSVTAQANTPAAVPAPVGAACGEGLANGGFEQDTDWLLPGTAYPAAYTSAKAHTGERSLRAGILMTTENVYSYSAANQAIGFPTTVPTDIVTATLSLWWWPVTTEAELTRTVAAAPHAEPWAEPGAEPGAELATELATELAVEHAADQATLQAIVDGVAPAAPLAGDRQYVILTNENNRVITSLLWARSNAQQWQESVFDLTPFRGRQLRVHVGVYNDGAGGVTAMYADDVRAEYCPEGSGSLYLAQIRTDPTLTPTLTPTATASPPPTLEPTATVTLTPTLEPTATPTTTVVWTDPPQAIEVFSPLAGGLYHSPIAVHGFSQTFEGVVNLRLVDGGGAVLAERTSQGGSVDGFAFFSTELRFTAGEEISATLEVFEESARDGSEIHKVSIPLTLLPGQRVVDLEAPRPGASVCSPIDVAGLSNTFEANVLITLSARGGEVLTSTTALGGNLGVYAPFAAPLAYTVAAPQPLLVGVTEGSAAGFGYIDYTRVPVALYAAGRGCPLPLAQN